MDFSCLYWRSAFRQTHFLFAAAEPGFMAFSILGDSMWVQVVKADGSILYETELKK